MSRVRLVGFMGRHSHGVICLIRLRDVEVRCVSLKMQRNP